MYDEDLTLLRSLSHEGCTCVSVSDCGGWVITSSYKENNARLWDVNTGEAVACVPADDTAWREYVALSRSASVFAVEGSDNVQLFDWSGAALGRIDVGGSVEVAVQFTPCGKYLVVGVGVAEDERYDDEDAGNLKLHQYDVATMACVLVIPDFTGLSFAISPCSSVVVFALYGSTNIVTRHLYPHNE